MLWVDSGKNSKQQYMFEHKSLVKLIAPTFDTVFMYHLKHTHTESKYLKKLGILFQNIKLTIVSEYESILYIYIFSKCDKEK